MAKFFQAKNEETQKDPKQKAEKGFWPPRATGKMDRRYRALESGALELTNCGFWHVLKRIPAQEKRWEFQATTIASSKLSTGHSVKWGTIGPKSGWFLLGMPRMLLHNRLFCCYVPLSFGCMLSKVCAVSAWICTLEVHQHRFLPLQTKVLSWCAWSDLNACAC